MESPPEISGYKIRNAKVPAIIAMRRLETLKPHEQVVESELLSLSRSISFDKVLRHPLLADATTGIVLDGTHRLVALRRMNYRNAPVALVDYQNHSIRVERWYRIIRPADLDRLRSDLEGLGLKMRSEDQATARILLDHRKVLAVIEDNNRAMVFDSLGQYDTLTYVRKGYAIESFLREKGLVLTYADKRPDIIPEETLVLSGIKLEKREVVDVAFSGRLYPPKSTRHLIPSRPLGTRVPTEWLALDTEVAQARLIEHLNGMKLTRIREGSTLGSRRYEEEVFLFE